MFECLKCQKRRAVYDNGEEYVRKPDYCPRCKKEIKGSFRQKGNKDIWERICGAGGFTEREVEDIKEKEAKRKAQELKNKDLLKKYRATCCLTSEEGARYQVDNSFMKEFYEDMVKTKERQADPDYPKVTKLKHLTIIELEELLSLVLGKQKYVKLALDKPSFDKHVIIPFTVQDADSSRKGRDSESKFKKIIKKALEGANWRLMSEGVIYRLGYLSGRLKGYEKEDIYYR